MQNTTELILHKRAIVISDLHVCSSSSVGAGDYSMFSSFLLEVIPRRIGTPVTLIVNGDFIDFPRILPGLGKHGLDPASGCSEAESFRKLGLAVQSHQSLFEALNAFMQRGNQVLIIPGNHDVDLRWHLVFESLRTAVGGFNPPAFELVSTGEISERRVH